MVTRAKAALPCAETDPFTALHNIKHGLRATFLESTEIYIFCFSINSKHFIVAYNKVPYGCVPFLLLGVQTRVLWVQKWVLSRMPIIALFSKWRKECFVKARHRNWNLTTIFRAQGFVWSPFLSVSLIHRRHLKNMQYDNIEEFSSGKETAFMYVELEEIRYI